VPELVRAALDRDIGLQGIQLKTATGLEEGYDVLHRGRARQQSRLARRLGFKAKATDVGDALERLLAGYESARTDGESLREWNQPTADTELEALLAGAAA